MLALALIIISLLLIQDILLTALLESNFRHYISEVPQAFPTVSILIPARNESINLPACLASLSKLSYPKEKTFFIFGDDQSSDNTSDLITTWIQNIPNAKLISITPQPAFGLKVNGKANALAQLAAEAVGDYYLFTDADCQVPQGWIEEMLAGCSSGVGVVTGITTVSGNSFFSGMQKTDWWLTLGMVKVLADLGIAITSMGNNMLITRKAYEKVGGFASIPFSLTEDFEMAKQVRACGYKGVHQVSAKNLIQTAAIEGFINLLEQRKRWMAGAFGLPLYWKALLVLQVCFFPAVLYLIAINPVLGTAVWGIKIFIQGVFLYRFSDFAGERVKWETLLIFEIYYLFTSWSTIVYYFWPSKTNWKGRLYP